MGSRSPSYAIGQVVKVFTYYNDMFVRDSFTAVITGINTYHIGQPGNVHHIYDVLSHKCPKLQIAEEFAIQPITEE